MTISAASECPKCGGVMTFGGPCRDCYDYGERGKKHKWRPVPNGLIDLVNFTFYCSACRDTSDLDSAYPGCYPHLCEGCHKRLSECREWPDCGFHSMQWIAVGLLMALEEQI